jgi:aminopeptidase N
MYQTSHTLEKPSLCTTKKEVLETLKELKGVHPFKILAKNAYDERDQKAIQKRQTKAKNQKKRKRQADKQAHAAGKKAAKKAVNDQAAKKAYEDAVMKHLSPEHV